ncbi:AtpZ/AtpI family protein [uncultured Phascolarctobacterium sp.]|uniref:AtpZ/AtpI family protein n=1 Tax=uncultured Phascolarctobacterium sp. TaxID=512296 RepID=UPI0025F7550B|nr:AtpZ/AtpI family protein [uncultured Phascolarctobacterium sp.]
MDKRKSDREYIRALNALATVSSLGFMAVVDFLLAYWGGNWLDNYFQTGDHTWRMACICLAFISIFLTFFKLVYTTMLDKDDEDEKK